VDNEASLELIDMAMGGVDMDGWNDTTVVLVFFLGLGLSLCLQKHENDVGTRDSLRRGREMKHDRRAFGE